MTRILTYLILIIVLVAAGCGGDEINNPKRADGLVYNINRYHIGKGLYEHTVLYAYGVDNVKYYGEFIAEDWTKQLTSSFEKGDILRIEYDSIKVEESKFIRKGGNIYCTDGFWIHYKNLK
jgi:hypothetical protein